MANNQMVTPSVEPVDPVLAFGYPATAFVETKNVGNGSFLHYIHYAGAITDGLFANAPNGSVGIDTTNGDTYVKTGAPGTGVDGAWTQT